LPRPPVRGILPPAQDGTSDTMSEPAKPITIYVDADACPVKAEVYRVAERYGIKVFVVSNSFMAIPRDPLFLEASAVGLPLSLIRKNPPQSALLFDQIAAELEDRIGLRAHKDQTHRHASLLD